LRDQLIEVGDLVVGELTAVLEQRPAQPFERGIGPLLRAPRFVYSLTGVSDDMELIEGDPGVVEFVGDAFDEGPRCFPGRRCGRANGVQRPRWCRHLALR
jgi:hypothetical protein